LNKTCNSKLTPNAKILRKNMTKEERHLWYDFLKLLPITINRQKVVGNYIVDFYCAEAKLVIELDGSQHFENQWRKSDKIRDSYLEKLGLKILRYSNSDVNRNFSGVCEDILKNISTSSTSSASLCSAPC